MRRLSGFLLAGAILLLPALSQHGTSHAQEALTFNGDTALWLIAIKPAGTGDFEAIMARVGEALRQSDDAQRNRQGAGWKVIKGVTPMPDGNIVYTHVIDPVVRGADYSIMPILYEAFEDPEERTLMYDMYSAAFGAALGANIGTLAVDLSRP